MTYVLKSERLNVPIAMVREKLIVVAAAELVINIAMIVPEMDTMSAAGVMETDILGALIVQEMERSRMARLVSHVMVEGSESVLIVWVEEEIDVTNVTVMVKFNV